MSVGDIVGHTIEAAAIMGQARSMLRQAAWEHSDDPPSAVLRAFELANSGLGVDARGTAILVRLHRPATGPWSLTWTNAGHPPPILIDPDGTAEVLLDHDVLFGFRISTESSRTDSRRHVSPGSTLLLYTDGLVERRSSDLDAGITRLVGALQQLRDRPVDEIVDTLMAAAGPASDDDVVAFAIRFDHD